MGTAKVPGFVKKTLGLKEKHTGFTLDDKNDPAMEIDENCYVGKDGRPGDDCVDFDPMHTPDGKMVS